MLASVNGWLNEVTSYQHLMTGRGIDDLRLEWLASGEIQEVMLTRSPILRRVSCNLQPDHPSAQHLKVSTRYLRSIVDEHVDESSENADRPNYDCRVEVVPASK